MIILREPEIRALVNDMEAVDLMREALVAHARREAQTPMPMHLDIAPESAEVHMKSSYRLGGKYFALKMAGTFPGNAKRGLPTGNGMMLLASAESGAPVALFEDGGYLTDLRTAAVSAMTARELGRADSVLGILGTGIQARLTARLHAAVLPLERIVIWGRNVERAHDCARACREAVPHATVEVAESPADVAAGARLIVTCTASRAPLLRRANLADGTHISAVGADSPGKQELDADILRDAALLLCDSLAQCESLGELQHALTEHGRAIEIGAFDRWAVRPSPSGITVADFTGLGVEDLFIAQYVYERSQS
ncbi:MAG: ornithine cyclodeaminase family protein [Bryobacteraceae bacterium]